MANEGHSTNVCNLCQKIGLRPFNKENIYFYYIPLHGTVSYFSLAIHVMNPGLVSKIMPKKDLSNVLLLSTLVGTAFYIYGRPSLHSIQNNRRGLYSLLGGTLFSMGSLLTWAAIKSMLPKNNTALATLAGLASGAVIVKLSRDFFSDTEKVIKSSK